MRIGDKGRTRIRSVETKLKDMETFYDSGLVIGAGGAPAIPIEGAVVVLVENGKRTYYDLSAVIDTIVTSCGRFMLDQSEIQDVPAAVAAAAGDPQERA